jgi:hypothetical protein
MRRECVLLRAARLYMHVDVASKPTTSVNQPEQCHMQTLQALLRCSLRLKPIATSSLLWSLMEILSNQRVCREISTSLAENSNAREKRKKSILFFYWDKICTWWLKQCKQATNQGILQNYKIVSFQLISIIEVSKLANWNWDDVVRNDSAVHNLLYIFWSIKILSSKREYFTNV